MAWINGISGPLNDKQQMQNAQMLVNGLYGKKGWTKESVSALIGNAHAESSVNPSRHEIGGTGYGLLQWTPMQKLVNYCNSIGKKYTTGEAQLAMINHEVDAGLQWIPNRKGAYAGGSSYRGSYKDFRTNKDKLSVNALTEAFMWNYEGPRADAAFASLATRQAFANRAFKELKWDESDPGSGGDGGDGSDPGGGDDKPTNVLQKDPVKVFKTAMEQMFTNIYFQNNSYLYKNFFIKITKQMNNMYKIKPTFNFSKMSLKDINDLFGLWHPEDTDGDGGNTGGGVSGGGGDKEGYYWPFKQDTMIMTSPFGPRNDTHGFHQGIDLTISNEWGKPICAIHSGTVLVAGDAPALPGWGEAGSMIIIKNDDEEGKYITYEEYAPGTNQVKKGDKVKGGQIIAHTGVSGNSTGVHLHLGISDPPGNYNVIPPAQPNVGWHDPSPYLGINNKARSYERPNNINKP